MKCPACNGELSSRVTDEVSVDVCEGGCAGIWLDAFELARVDETLPREIRDVARDPSLVIDQDRKRACPRCDGVKMQRHFFSADHRVEVDSCPGCGGYWLDAGELEAIRKDVKTQEPVSGPIRVDLKKDTKPAATGSKLGGAGNRTDRACTLQSLYTMLGSKY